MIDDSLRPTQRAGSTKTGSMMRATRVICHDRKNIAPSTITTLTKLLTTLESVSVKACCAPSTSLLRRLTSAPVWVRVKNASGMRCTWRNTSERMSKMRPSPTVADTQRSASDSAVSTMASTATSSDSFTTSCESLPMMPLLMIERKISGFRAPRNASSTIITRNTVSSRL